MSVSIRSAVFAGLFASAPRAVAMDACTPLGKFECRDGQCLAQPRGSFEHAESFSFDRDAGTLGTCQWTACYEGPATVLETDDAHGTVVATGLLAGADGRRMPLTLAIDRDRRFTAVWNHDGGGATVSTGYFADFA